MLYFVVDIGGTTTRISFSNDLKALGKVEKIETPQSFAKGISVVINRIKQLAAGKKINAICVAVAGVLDGKKEKLLKSPHLKGWVNKPLAKTIARDLKTKVFLGNDSDIAGVGEAVEGGGKGKKIVAFISLGTGIGGSRIINGRPDVFSSGFEPGHQIIKLNGRRWSCGQKGCWEAYVSGSAFIKHPISWEEYVPLLGQGIINVVVLWSPDVVVIGGGFSERSKYFIRPLRAFVNKNLMIFKSPAIKIGELGDRAGLVGGLHYLKSIRRV